MMEQIIVTETSKNLRALGHGALSQNKLLALKGALLYIMAITLPAALLTIFFLGTVGDSASALYSLLVSGPFTLGVTLFYMNMFRGKAASLGDVFYGFDHFVKAFGLFIIMSVLIFLWSLLLIVPGIIASFRYSQAFLILADNPEYKALDCIRESKRLMNGNKMKLLYLTLSFMGWILLFMILPFGILTMLSLTGVLTNILTSQILALLMNVIYIWILAYMMLTLVAFYEILTGSLKAEKAE